MKLQSGKGDILVEKLQAEPVPDTGNGGIWHLQSGNRLKRNNPWNVMLVVCRL